METKTTIITLILLTGLILSPIFIIRKLNKLNSNNTFISYLVIGIMTTAIMTFTYAWWSATSNELLLAYYGYNIDGMNEREFYRMVAPENMERVKRLETSIMGIGWPLKAIMMYVVCLPYLLIVYFVNVFIQKSKRTTPNTSSYVKR